MFAVRRITTDRVLALGTIYRKKSSFRHPFNGTGRPWDLSPAVPPRLCERKHGL